MNYLAGHFQIYPDSLCNLRTVSQSTGCMFYLVIFFNFCKINSVFLLTAKPLQICKNLIDATVTMLTWFFFGFRELGLEHRNITLNFANKRINFNTPLNLENSTHLAKSDNIAQLYLSSLSKMFRCSEQREVQSWEIY